MGGQRKKLRDHIFNNMQKSECKNWKWGEYITPRAHPQFSQEDSHP